MRELSNCARDLHISHKKKRKGVYYSLGGFTFRAVSAVKHSFPALAQHFQKASKNETGQSGEKARFQGLLSKLALMADVFND